MRLSLEKRLSLAMLGVVGLALFSSVVALLSSWHLAMLLERAVGENLPSVRAAEELEVAVLEQRGFVSSYLLDDRNPEWLEQLKKRERNFGFWLGRAYDTANTPEEEEILKALEKVYREYDAARDEVVALCDQGDIAAATKLLVNDVAIHYNNAYELCESFIEANERFVDAAVAAARRQVWWTSVGVVATVAVTIGLGAVLAWLFFHGIVFPIRAMVHEARGFVGESSSESESLPTDELRAVGTYLQNLMSDVADTRGKLDQSRSELKESEKLASVGKLAASVAHEIRNPLTAIKMWLFSIQKEMGGAEISGRKFAIIAEEIRRLERIVREFLEFSRPPEVKLAIESIPKLLDTTLVLIEPRLARRNTRLIREDAPDLPLVSGDHEQLRQVLLNLLNNATDAVGDDGQIRVVTSEALDPQKQKIVVVRVSDNGPGIPEEVAHRIFEPFFTTKDEGTGLGLCIAARIMARHEGRLVLETSTNKGTTLAMHLPAASAK